MAELQPGREFHGQRFVRHQADRAAWTPWRIEGFEVQDTGIGEATRGLAGVRVVRAAHPVEEARQRHETEFCFYFVLSGRITLQLEREAHALAVDDSAAISGGMPYHLVDASSDLKLLEITLPAEF
jgi:mannose-6-phosphate isomerase-like protein (cupin superfamily)